MALTVGAGQVLPPGPGARRQRGRRGRSSSDTRSPAGAPRALGCCERQGHRPVLPRSLVPKAPMVPRRGGTRRSASRQPGRETHLATPPATSGAAFGWVSAGGRGQAAGEFADLVVTLVEVQ